MASSPGLRWWAEKVGRVMSYAGATVSDRERAELATMLTPALLDLFGSMPPADQRHGLDVAASLRRGGFAEDQELVLAGLLHDAGKGRTVRLWHRIAWSLGQRYGRWIERVARVAPGARPVFDRLDRHAELSADLAAAAGAPSRTVALIRGQAPPQDPGAMALQLADEGELSRRPEPIRTR